MASYPKNLKFEAAMEKLEKMISRLEEGELPLEDSLKVFEEGMTYVKFCEQKLAEAEAKVEILVKEKEGATK